MPNPKEPGPYTTRRTPKGPGGEKIAPFGVGPSDTPSEIQITVFKELINKLSWTIGSTYKKRYSGKSTEVADYARMCAHAIVRDHGYPVSSE